MKVVFRYGCVMCDPVKNVQKSNECFDGIWWGEDCMSLESGLSLDLI